MQMLAHIKLSVSLILLLTACSTIQSETIVINEEAQPPPEMTPNQDNPFFYPSNLPFEAPDFEEITNDHYLPAFTVGMQRQLEEINQITSNAEAPDFDNTILPLERSGALLTRVQRVFFNMTSAHTNDRIQEIQAEVAPRLAAHSDNIRLNNDLFERVKTLYDNRENLDLEPESLRLLEETYLDFIRAGAQLSNADQSRIREINEQLSSLTTQFQESLLAMTRERAVLVDSEDELDGLTSGRIAAAAEAATERGHEGQYLLSITNTTRQPILSSLNNRDLRRRVWEASAYRGLGQNGGIDTRPILLDLVRLRTEKANILGYSNWAAYSLERNTASNPENALDMMTDLVPAVIENTTEEATRIQTMMQEENIQGDLEPWDWEYYAEKVRRDLYNIDENEVRPYFELNRVLEDGVFYTMNRLFGITFEERFDMPVYHPDVRVFNVYNEDGSQIGLFYGDYFARDSKSGGAWMSSFVGQSRLLDKHPVIVNVLNIPKPAEGEPALISFDNVTTLFHEIGHAVHGLFSNVEYPSLAGTSVPRDFVEFPSTFQEDWAIHPDVLSNYAVHYERGGQIPEELVERVIEAREFNQGFDTQEYLAAALLDMEWHTLSASQIPENVLDFEESALAKYNLNYDPVPPRYRTPFFAHIFSGSYSANYYAYIWSEVLAADAFAYMMSNGGLTRENGNHFRNTILSKGGSKEAMELYIDFREREPDVQHLLERRGLN